MKIKIFILLIILLSCYFYTQGAEKKVIPEKLRPILKEAGREDPFLLPTKEDKPQFIEIKKLQLQGILWDESKPLAIINAEVVSEGQKIGDKKIIKIEKDSVIVETQDGESHTIELHQKGGSK